MITQLSRLPGFHSPSVSLGVHSGIRLATMGDVEEGLEFLNSVSNGASLNSVRESLNSVVGDDFARLEDAGHEVFQGVRVRLADDGSKSED